MKNSIYKHVISLALLLVTCSVFANNLKLGVLFQKQMVLQRNVPIKVWGKALPNNLISITFKNKTIEVFSNTQGNRIATLPKVKAGERFNIHPSDKLPIGQRIVFIAEKATLKRKDLTDGLKMKKFKVKGNQIIVTYSNSKGLKTIDSEAPQGFWVSDINKKGYKADAQIKGRKDVLTANGLETSIHIRYPFSAKPIVNLVNQANLAAIAFKTDNYYN